MDEIVCANTAFRYWRCPPQVRDLYPRLPSSEDDWRALAQAPFVTDILKVPIITSTEPGGVNYHSGLRTTIHCGDASRVDSTLETDTMTQSEGTKKIGAPARDRGSGLRQ